MMPSLTHLALQHLNTTMAHNKVIAFLARCPNLEVVVLQEFGSRCLLGNSLHEVIKLPHKRLLRFTLGCSRTLSSDFINFYLQHLLPNPPRALQILYCPGDYPGKLLLERLCSAPRKISLVSRIGLYPDYLPYFSGTVVGAETAVHIQIPRTTSWWVDTLMSPGVSLLDVREAWFDGIYPSEGMDTYEREGDPLPMHTVITNHEIVARQVRNMVMAALPALETIVVVFHDYYVEPHLHLLPNMNHPSFVSKNLKTLRIVVTLDLLSGSHPMNSTEKITLKLLEMRKELATGRFRYLETIIFQVAPHVNVSDHDLQRLRKYVKTVEVEHVDTVPKMQLPEYCIERNVPARQDRWARYGAW